MAAGREFQAAGPQTAKLRVSPDHNVSTNVDMSERSSPIPEYRDLSDKNDYAAQRRYLPIA